MGTRTCRVEERYGLCPAAGRGRQPRHLDRVGERDRLRAEVRRVPRHPHRRADRRQGPREGPRQGARAGRLRPPRRARRREAGAGPQPVRRERHPRPNPLLRGGAVHPFSTAFGVFGPNPISDYLRAVIAYLPRVFAAVIILVVAAAIAAAVRSLVDNLLGGLSYGPALATLASAAIIFLGIIAALNQLNIAANVVNALLYAVLAVIVGVVVVAVGGGGIGPMAERWRALLARYDQEKPRLQQTASARGEQLKAQARDTASQRGDDRRGDGGSHPLP